MALDIVALNCGTGMDMSRARQAVERYRKVTRSARDGAAERGPAEARST